MTSLGSLTTQFPQEPSFSICQLEFLPPFPFFPPFLPSSRVTCCDFVGATSGEVSYFENRDSRREEERREGKRYSLCRRAARPRKRERETRQRPIIILFIGARDPAGCHILSSPSVQFYSLKLFSAPTYIFRSANMSSALLKNVPLPRSLNIVKPHRSWFQNSYP